MSDYKPKPPVPSKALKASRKVRIAQVLDWLVGGLPTGEIEKMGAAQFNVTPRSIRKDITHCRHKILPTWFEWTEKRVMVAELLAKLERILAKAIAKSDLHAAVRCIRQTSELMGLNSPRMIAAERGTLASELQALKQGTGDSEGDSTPREQVNAQRASYGQPAFATDEDYQNWLDGMSPNTGNN